MASRYCWCYRDCWLSKLGNYNKKKCLQFKQAKQLYRQSSLLILYGNIYCHIILYIVLPYLLAPSLCTCLQLE